MICPKCGAENTVDGATCSECGEEPHTMPIGTEFDPKRAYDHLFLAVAATFIGFMPVGLVALFYAGKVNRRLAAGDYDGAASASKRARKLSYVAIALMPFVIVIVEYLRSSGFFGT